MENQLPQVNQSPLVAAAEFLKVSGDMDVEKLSRLLELQEKWEANQARKAYTEAMTNFKKKAPDIFKDKNVKYATSKGTTEYNHATLFNVTETIGKALGEQGLSASWLTSQKDNLVTVTCKITHTLGHFEETGLTASPDLSGSKNPIQAIGSTVSYLQRYTLLALTGLATKDQDDDAVNRNGGNNNSMPKVDLEEKEDEFLNMVCNTLKLPKGFLLNRKNIKAAIITELKGKPFPTEESRVNNTVSMLMTKYEKTIFDKDAIPYE